MAKKILLVYKFNHPDVEQIRAALAAQFPQYPIDLLNIKELVRSHMGICLANFFIMFKEYPLRQLNGYWKIWRRFWATTYIHQQIQRLMAACVADNNYVFSFQIQSDYDAACPGLPHFIYADTTNLANLYTPGYTQDKLYSSAWRELEKETYRNAGLIFVRSSHIRRSLLEQYGISPEKIVLAYSGYNAGVKDLDLDHMDYTKQNILFVGVAWERKGGPDLVKAFEKVLVKFPKATLTIVGCHPKIDVRNVQVIGRLPLEEVAGYYRQASIFCLPTRLEPFGVVFIEAMAYGLPLVAPRAGAAPDFVQDGRNGYLVEPGDIDGLAEALAHLLEDPERCRAFGKAGCALVQERYTWEKVGRVFKTHILPVIKENT
jgi:glycosyltransferase involved in cell wall biosynthesis